MKTKLYLTEEPEEPPSETPSPEEPAAPGPLVAEAKPIPSDDSKASASHLSEQFRNNWFWQMRHRIRSTAELARFFNLSTIHLDIGKAENRFPMAITPYYASLIQRLDASDPIFLQSVPQVQELRDPPFLHEDPLEEDQDMPVPGLVHRYPDRALLLSTSTCAMYCRHCTRKRVAGVRERVITAQRLEGMIRYLRAHPEIKDVIISGGDPLTMRTPVLERLLQKVRSVSSVEIIRLGTRVPVTLPMRVTEELVTMLERYQPLWLNTQFNHPRELTPESIQALDRLARAGIPLGNQSVLLRGVNDEPAVIESLCRALVRNRVRPQYLFQCDLVRGVEHFRTPISRGIQVMEYLRGRLSGLAIPTFVVDAPHGGGKIPVLPTYIMSMSPTHMVLRNFEGLLVSYPEPGANTVEALPLTGTAGPTVADLATGCITKMTPVSSSRMKRRTSRATSGRVS